MSQELVKISSAALWLELRETPIRGQDHKHMESTLEPEPPWGMVPERGCGYSQTEAEMSGYKDHPATPFPATPHRAGPSKPELSPSTPSTCAGMPRERAPTLKWKKPETEDCLF